MTRLDALYSLITPADVIADVGCDHGLIAERCVKAGLARRVIASDISEKCLKKAVNALDGYTGVEFVVCDGIGYACDEAVIAGMGGLLIKGIIERASAEARLPETLVLMPHRDADSVRRALTDSGYRIEKELIIKDKRRFYFAMRAVKTENAERLSELQYLFGTDCGKKNDLLAEYLKGLYDTYIVAPERNESKLKYVRAALLVQGVTAP